MYLYQKKKKLSLVRPFNSPCNFDRCPYKKAIEILKNLYLENSFSDGDIDIAEDITIFKIRLFTPILCSAK